MKRTITRDQLEKSIRLAATGAPTKSRQKEKGIFIGLVL